MALAFVGSHAFSVFASVLTCGLALAPGDTCPTPAAVDPSAVSTQPIGRGHLSGPPAVEVRAHSEPAGPNQRELYDPHLLACTVRISKRRRWFLVFKWE